MPYASLQGCLYLLSLVTWIGVAYDIYGLLNQRLSPSIPQRSIVPRRGNTLNIFPMIPFVIFAVLCIATIVAIATFKHLMMEDPEKLLTKIATREDPLLDYVEKLENINIDDEALWVAVGRVRGLLQLSRDACRLLFLYTSLSLRQRDNAEYQLNLQRVKVIIASLPGCALESVFLKVIPAMPRVSLRLAATQYCKICLSLHTVVSAFRPDMIDRLAEVL
jgi:hypothetical protein